ncbi:hypothetical protein GX48_03580 [Paracoccidioides brasiliensis]|nr:hypothetical protein GX48_03580 [Paracoccidioides brasiliensis]
MQNSERQNVGGYSRTSAAFPDRDKCAYERYETLLANISATGLVVGQTSESPIKMLTLELNAYQIK